MEQKNQNESLENHQQTIGAPPLQPFTLFGERVRSYRKFTADEIELLTDIFSKDPLTTEEYLKLPKEQGDRYRTAFAIALNKLTLDPLDKAIERLSFMNTPSIAQQVWDKNHSSILNFLGLWVSQENRFPNITEISRNTGLSRVTVTAHMKDYYGGDQYEKNKSQLILLREKILFVAAQRALAGDIRAAKIFMDATSQFVLPPITHDSVKIFIESIVNQVISSPMPPAQLNDSSKMQINGQQLKLKQKRKIK